MWGRAKRVRVRRVLWFCLILRICNTSGPPRGDNEYAALPVPVVGLPLLTHADYNNYETSYTSYGAGGGAGGGGFIPGEGGSQQSPGGRRDYTQDSLRPVTIKQILDAQPDAGADSFKIDGATVSQVRGCHSFLLPFLTSLPAHLCRTNTQHLDTDHQHHLQAR
jgi:hypothetical protein